MLRVLVLVLDLVVIALFGFLLSRTFMAPAIDSGTRFGVDVINGSHD